MSEARLDAGDPLRRATLQLYPVSGVLGLNEHTPVRHPPTGPDHSTEFTNFMRAYQDMVFSTAARLAGNDRQAEDIAQEVFLRAYEHFANLSTSPSAGGCAAGSRTSCCTHARWPWRPGWVGAGDWRSPFSRCMRGLRCCFGRLARDVCTTSQRSPARRCWL